MTKRKYLIAFVSLLAVVSGAVAEPTGPTLGCFAREYSKEHLATHPDQFIARMVLWFHVDQSGTTEVGNMAIWTANQGRIANTDQVNRRYDQFLLCWEDAQQVKCAVECDGGSLNVSHDDGTKLVFETDGLWVGETDECGGAINLTEKPNEPVAFLLNRTGESQCKTVFPDRVVN